MNSYRNKSFFDCMYILLFSITCLLIFSYFDISESINNFFKEYEKYELDEIVLFLIVLSFSLLWYSIRRFNEIKNIRDELENAFKEKSLESQRIKNNLNIAVKMANLGTWEWEIANDTSKWSDITYEIYGLDNNTSITTPLIKSLVYKDDLEKYTQQINKAINENKLINFEYRILRNAEIKTLLVIGNPIVENNNVTKIVGVVHDITEIKKKEKRLELEKKKLHTIIHMIPDPLWIKDKDGVYLACNKRFEDFFGAKEEQIVGKTDYDFVDKELADFFREHDQKAMASSTPLSNFETLPFSDGHKEFVETTKTKVILDDGLIYGILGVSRNITEIKKLEEQLLNAQRIGGFGSYVFDIKNNIWESSKELNKIFGLDEDYEKTAQSWLDIVHSDYKKEMGEYLQNNILTQKQKFDKIYKIVDQKTLEIKWVHGRGELLLDNNEEPIELFGMIQDITFQKQKEEIIQSQKEEFKTVFNYSHDSIVITDLDANFLNCNDSFLELTKLSKDEILTKNCRDLTAPEYKKKYELAFQEAIEKGHRDNFEKECIFKNNKRVSVNMSISLLPDKQRLLLTLKDMSNLKILEEQSRLASMGEMIGNIAHQWRQPLSMITTNVSGLQLRSSFEDVTKDDIDKCAISVIKQANYLSSTIDNFRNFIKDEKSNNFISLKNVIENTLTLVKASLDNNYIKVILDIEDDMEIFGNKNELIEALINIVNNGKDILKSKVQNEEDRLLFITTKKIGKNKTNLLIYDSGGGIPEKDIEKIFIPYFTTKHQSVGTGLGLAIVDKIIRVRHKGIITVYNKEFEYNSKQYKGACFSIILEFIDR